MGSTGRIMAGYEVLWEARGQAGSVRGLRGKCGSPGGLGESGGGKRGEQWGWGHLGGFCRIRGLAGSG